MAYRSSDYSSHSRASGGFSFSALVLIGLGGIFLANNFGVLPWEIWANLWKFWPVLLILFGLETLIGRNSSPKGLLILIGLIFLLPLFLVLNPLTGNPLANASNDYSAPLGNLSRGKLVFDLPAANIKINALEEGDKIFQGQVKYSNLLPKPEVTEEEQLGTGVFTFNQKGQKTLPFLNNLGNNLTFSLSPQVPFEIKTKTSGTLDFDLAKVRVDFLEIENSAGAINISFAPDHSTKVFIKTTSSPVKLTLPEKVAARVKTDSEDQEIVLDEERFDKSGQTYRSIDFEVARDRVDIELSGKAGKVEVIHSEG
jgi:hypothetical protein